MRSWPRIGVVGTVALALLFAIPGPPRASGQVSERFNVMVTNLTPLDGADDDFGKDLGKLLRKLVSDLATHRAVEEKDLKNVLKQHDLKMEDLDCALSLQLAAQGHARIVFCGSYTENRQERTFTLSGVRFASPGSSPLEIPDRTWHTDEVEMAAQEIAASFEAYVTQLRHAQFCGDFYNSGDYDSSERTCRMALEIAPNDPQVLLVLAQVLRRTDRLDEAYVEVLKVLELDPLDGTALQLAGFLATSLGRPQEEARAYYDKFLQLNPGNVPVRLKIAYELAQAGDPEGAMLFVAEGLAIEPANTDLLEQHASFAIEAGRRLQVEGQPISPEAAELYRKGADSYGRAYDASGSEMALSHLYQMIAALVELDRLDRGLAVVGEVLETHGGEARMWVIKGDILKKLDRLEEALLALDTAVERDPAYKNIRAKRGQWFLEAGREEDALPVLREAVEKGEQPADVIASMFFGAAVRKGIEVDDWGYALKMIEMAKTFESGLSDSKRGQLDFYSAYALYSQAVAQQAPQNQQSAELTLPKFQEVARLLGLSHVTTYAREKQPGLFKKLSENNLEYVKIQEAVLQRGN